MRRFHEVMLVVCLLAGVLLFRDFLTHPRSIWTGLVSDRSGHYGYGLDLALELKHGDVRQFFAQLEKGKVWPPLHGLMVMVTQLVSGNDWRLAVLPSLTGWILMLWCVWFTAQKIATPTGIPWVAGSVGLIFAVLSPAGRLYGTEIMLESLGAGLTMAVLACYASAVEQRDSRERWRLTAIALSVSFFEKYNYWMIVAVSLGLAESGTLIGMVRGWLREINLKKLIVTELKQPLNWLLLAMAVLVLWIFARGPTAFQFFGKRVSLYPPHNLITATYAVFFLRAMLFLRSAGWKPRNAQEAMLWKWHILPVAVSFLLPQRLSVFVGFLSPANHDVAPRNFAGAISYYSTSFVTDYNISMALAVVAAVLACFALVHFKVLGPAARAVLICMVLGATLNILHPNQKSRYMHSWIPAVWTAAGLGSALLLSRVPRRSLIAGAGIAVLAVAGGRAWQAQAAATHGPERSLLDMSDVWLANVKSSHRVAFFSTQTCRSFIEWTFLREHESRDLFEWPVWQDSKSEAGIRAGFNNWLAQTQADTVLFFEVPKDSPQYVPFCDQAALRENLGKLLAEQTKFTETKKIDFPLERCSVTIWQRHQ